MNTIFAFCGPIGSGKSSVSKLFAATLGATWNSFGSVSRNIAQERGLPATRHALQTLGANLVSQEASVFSQRVIGPALKEISRPGVIDGLRHVHMLEFIRELLGTRRLALIYIDAPLVTRRQRVRDRDGLSEAQLADLDRHSTEVEVENELKARADFIADNSGTTESCASGIVHWANRNR